MADDKPGDDDLTAAEVYSYAALGHRVPLRRWPEDVFCLPPEWRELSRASVQEAQAEFPQFLTDPPFGFGAFESQGVPANDQQAVPDPVWNLRYLLAFASRVFSSEQAGHMQAATARALEHFRKVAPKMLTAGRVIGMLISSGRLRPSAVCVQPGTGRGEQVHARRLLPRWDWMPGTRLLTDGRVVSEGVPTLWMHTRFSDREVRSLIPPGRPEDIAPDLFEQVPRLWSAPQAEGLRPPHPLRDDVKARVRALKGRGELGSNDSALADRLLEDLAGELEASQLNLLPDQSTVRRWIRDVRNEPSNDTNGDRGHGRQIA